jgi:flagellar motor switch protein FliN/FliY
LSSPSRPAAGTLDLLMDVEMPVSVRFGSTSVLLRDIIAWTQGSLVEFYRSPDEPADIVVNGQVVARGAVVVVQGHYGVRITEVAGLRENMLDTGENG